jgi:alpha-beta hydrolase superfamily lysophospholipase
MQMDYVLSHSASRDGKVLGVGHSMGGILLYAMLATRGRCKHIFGGPISDDLSRSTMLAAAILLL